MRAPRTRLAALGACVLVGLGGCGHKQGAPIPRSLAGDIISRLGEADRRSASMACHDLRTDTLPTLERQASQLPANVDSNVRTTVSDGINHLRDLVAQQCSASQSSSTTSSSQTSTATTTAPTTTQTTTTAPPPPPAPTTTQTTTHTTTAPPPTTTQTTNGGGASPPGNGPGGGGPPGQKGKAG